MKYVGIDLHKKTIVLCVVNKARKVLERRNFLCLEVARIAAYFRALGPFQFVVEATATYEWLVQLLEPLAKEWVLAHPGKMRVIAETAKKTDKLDAQTLAEFLALGMIPKAYRPTARQREHRVLVRYRVECRQRLSRLKCQIRYLAATYNADQRDLFQAEHLAALRQRPELTGADRFVLEQRLASYEQALERLAVAKAEVKRFAQKGSAAEQHERGLLRSAPGVGEVVSEVVLAELGDATRFGSIKEATAYAGLVPGKRESAGKGKELGITKKGSRLLRWAMVEAAWQAVRHSPRWRSVYAGLKRRRGVKRAIIAVARRLLGLLTSMLKAGQQYRSSLAELKEREAQAEQRKARRRVAKKVEEAAAV
jgi:transposase